MFDPEHLTDPHPMRHKEDRRPSKADLRKLKQAQETIMRLHMFIYGQEVEGLHVPDAWKLLPDRYPPEPRKVRVTLLLEEPVAKFFRGYGRGYQALVNDVLKAYAQLRAAKLIEGAEDRGPGGEAV